MALEPRTVTLEEREPRAGRHDAPLLVVGGAHRADSRVHGVGVPARASRCIALLPHGWLNWVLLALATPVVLWGGWPFFVRGWASVVNRHLNMFTLIALGVGAAYGYSVVATLAPGLLPGLVPA